MTKRTRLFVIAASAVAALAVALFAVWWFVLRSNAPAPVSLDEAVSAATSSTEPGAAPATSASTAPVLDGEWKTIDGNGSFAGYRVQEELATIGFTTAAGRTTDLSASLAIENGAVVAVDVTVNMQTLRSDSDRRDGAMRNQGLETNAFPEARFTLIEPIPLPDDAESSAAFQATAIGELEIHGVTNRVELELEAQMVDGVIAVIGSARIQFADYQIDQPSALAVLSVDDTGIMEFQLLFERV